MHAFLLITKKNNYESFLKKFNADVIEDSLFKIADVKRIIKETNLKLLKKTVYVIKDFDLSSTEAQNAFLKRLEEPQENLIFVLTAKSEEKILPTILSRVSVVRDQKTENDIQKSDFLSLDLNAKFLFIDKIKNREEAKEFLNNLLNSSKNDVVLETLHAINANGNVSLQLTNMVAKLTKIG